MKFPLNLLAIAASGVCIVLGATGCASLSGSAEDSLVSVNILNRPLVEVQAAVTKVFSGHSYVGGPTGAGQFTFQRPGNSTDDLAYGSYLFDRKVTVRVVVTTQQRAPDLIAVGCKAWIIEAEGDPVLEDKHPVRALRKGPYEELLNEIKAQFGQ